MRVLALFLTLLAVAQVAPAQTVCQRLDLTALGVTPDTIEIICEIPGDLIRVILVPGEADTVVVMPDGTEVPWPGDIGDSLPPEGTWTPSLAFGMPLGTYAYVWNRQIVRFAENTTGTLSALAPEGTRLRLLERES